MDDLLANTTSAVNVNTRQWSEVRQSLWATHVAGLVAYYQLGVITNRNGAKWDGQNIILPLVFPFFPLLYPCQMLVSFLLIARNFFWRDYQGLNYYICGLLGMYAARSDYRKEDGSLDLFMEKKGHQLLIDNFWPVLQPRRREWSEVRGSDLIISILALYQAVSTSILYIRRWAVPDVSLLDVDHRIGLMAIGGSMCGLSYILFQVTGYDWVHKGYGRRTVRGPQRREPAAVWPEATLHKSKESERHLGDSLDTSNKYVYDCALAVGAQFLFFRYIRRCLPFFSRDDYLRPQSAFWWPTVLPYVVLGVTAIPLCLQAFWSTSFARFYQRLPGGGSTSRFCVLLACLYVSITTIWSEVEEMKRVNNNELDAWNTGWAWKDPWSNFLWPL